MRVSPAHSIRAFLKDGVEGGAGEEGLKSDPSPRGVNLELKILHCVGLPESHQ
jgi:hypothetical protein